MPASFPVPQNKISTDLLSKLSLPTLFHTYYNLTDQIVQKASAIELCKRGWVLDLQKKIWILNKDLQKSCGLSEVTIFVVSRWRIEKLKIDCDQLQIVGMSHFKN